MEIGELVRFADFYFCGAYAHFVIERDPVGFLSVVLAMDVAEAEELQAERIGAIFLFDFFSYRVLDGVVYFKTTPAKIPAVLFIACMWAATMHHESASAIVTEERHGNTGVINAGDLGMIW